MNITIVGTGYVGLVTGASLANLGHTVLCVDVDQSKITRLEQGVMPFYEQGLQELVAKNKQQKRLAFTTDMAKAVEFGDVIFNCVGTPEQGDGSANLQYVFAVTRDVGRLARDQKILVNKSTVPPGTALKCSAILAELQSPVEVVSNPEFLKQGNAVYDFNHPDKIVVGAQSEKGFHALQKVYHGLIKTYIPIIETNWETAEMIKYANNSFLATKISFINEIANICDATGADVKTVAKAIGMDYRIGPRFLNAGIGYGGSCFPKDVKAIIAAAKEYGYQAQLLQEVNAFNERQKKIMLPKIRQKIKPGEIVTLWGLSFKPRTSDMRGAPSLELIKELNAAGIKMKAYDPIAIEEAQKNITAPVEYHAVLEESLKDSSAIILVTEWDEFRNLPLAELGKEMKQRILFDGRNIYEPEQVREQGFEYIGVGRGSRA